MRKCQLSETPLHRHLLVMSTHTSPTPAHQACTLLVAWHSTQLSVWRVDGGRTHQRHVVVAHLACLQFQPTDAFFVQYCISRLISDTACHKPSFSAVRNVFDHKLIPRRNLHGYLVFVGKLCGGWIACVCLESCPPVPALRHASLTSFSSCIVGSTATFECQPGYFFSDGSNEKSISCQSNAQWQETGTCQSSCCDVIV